MRRETKTNQAKANVVGYLLAVVGFLVMIFFFALGNITILANLLLDIMGGVGKMLEGNLGTATWLGVGIMVLGITIIMIEETKEEE